MEKRLRLHPHCKLGLYNTASSDGRKPPSLMMMMMLMTISARDSNAQPSLSFKLNLASHLALIHRAYAHAPKVRVFPRKLGLAT